MPSASTLGPERRFMGLTLGNSLKKAYVDELIYPRVRYYTWWVNKSHTCGERILTQIGKVKYSLANLVMGDLNDSLLTYDHKDGDIYNNRQENLRVATKQQQACNRDKFKGTANKYKGVRFRKECTINPWKAVITNFGKTISLGYYKTEEKAAKAYDNAAKIYHGEFANLNFKDKT